MRRSGTRRVGKRAPESKFTDECRCATCRRPMAHELKHCVLDAEAGAFIMCDTCYLRDERRFAWEHRANPLPVKRGRVARR